MTSPRKAGNQIIIYPNSKEREKFDYINQELRDKLHISKQRQSELFMQAYFELTERLISSHVPNTQTFPHSRAEEKLAAISEMLSMIIEKPRNLSWFFTQFFTVYKETFSPAEDMRVILKWFRNLLLKDELLILDLTASDKIHDYYVIQKGSFWHAQFNKWCSKAREEHFDFQPSTEFAAKKRINEVFKKYYGKKERFDEVHKFNITCFDNFQYNEEAPFTPDPIYTEITNLRSQWKHAEADELLIKNQEHHMEQLQALRSKPVKKDSSRALPLSEVNFPQFYGGKK